MSDKGIIFSAPMWAYLLGVVHGDGHVSKRSISISVGYRDREYADELIALLTEVGFVPKVYRTRSAMRIDVHSVDLANQLRLTKTGGRWTLPDDLAIGPYLAGLIDTDGHTTKPPQRQIVITLKRSGNLEKVCDRLVDAGLRCNPVKYRTQDFLGRPYEIEEVRWAGGDQIEWIAEHCELRSPRKAARLRAMAMEVAAIRAQQPLWAIIADWLTEAPRDIDEIRAKFGLTKAQADSVIGNIRLNADLEVIPPPRLLTKYRVKK